jgi:hypothetical protein
MLSGQLAGTEAKVLNYYSKLLPLEKQFIVCTSKAQVHSTTPGYFSKFISQPST